jgi:hypothetical protein
MIFLFRYSAKGGLLIDELADAGQVGSEVRSTALGFWTC